MKETFQRTFTLRQLCICIDFGADVRLVFCGNKGAEPTTKQYSGCTLYSSSLVCRWAFLDNKQRHQLAVYFENKTTKQNNCRLLKIVVRCLICSHPPCSLIPVQVRNLVQKQSFHNIKSTERASGAGKNVRCSAEKQDNKIAKTAVIMDGKKDTY